MRRAGLWTHKQFSGLMLTAACATLAAGCLGPRAATSKPTRVNHVVICWLADPTDTDQRDELLMARQKLAAIPGVREVRAGTVLPSERPIVDSTYDVAFIMSFSSIDGLRDYLVHPEHDQLVRDVLKPLTKRVVVYDFVELLEKPE